MVDRSFFDGGPASDGTVVTRPELEERLAMIASGTDAVQDLRDRARHALPEERR